MTKLQEQMMQLISDMPEENLKVLVNFIQIFVQPQNETDMSASKQLLNTTSKRIGIAEGENLYDHNYDIDEYNDEIAKIFGVI